MQAEATDLIEDGGRVGGLRATTPAGTLVVKPTSWSAPTASTRPSAARGLVEDIGAPIDVLWMRLPRRPSDGTAPLGRFGAGKIFIMLDRGDYWQCAYVIPKGGFDEIKAKGLDAFRAAVAEIAPQFGDRVRELELGRHQAAHRQDRPAAQVAPSASSASATRRTRCRRSAASASISRSRTRWRPPISWRRRCAARCASATLPPPSAAPIPHPRDAEDAGVHAEQSAARGVGQPSSAGAAVAVAADRRYPLLQRIGPPRRDGISPRARAPAGGRS